MTASALPKLAGFAAALVLLLGGGALAGGLIDPSPPKRAENSAMHEEDATTGMNAATMAPRGLAVAENGLCLVVDRPTFTRGREQQLRFRIVDERGETVRDFDVEHTKRMHLIVVRRDLTGFQHLHPVEDDQGNWTTPLRLDEPGTYRMYADFSHDETATTLADDLTVDGTFSAQPLAAPKPMATTTDGYTVELDAPHVDAGDESALRFTVLRDGRPVQVEPYLGADGHLVALRQGDLAFLHVHPTGGKADRRITFDATFPTTSKYRLFLQFKADGRVHSAAFTQEVA